MHTCIPAYDVYMYAYIHTYIHTQDVYTDETLEEHEVELENNKKKLAALQPILKLVERREAIQGTIMPLCMYVCM